MRSACRRRKTGTCSGEEPRYPSNVRIEREVEEEKGMTRRHPVYLLFKHDLRANAFRVCREGKPVPTFPDHALEPCPEDHREKRCVSKDEAPYWNALVSTFRRLRRDSAAMHRDRRGLLLPGRVCDMDRR